jgi:hypothetical protein
LSYGDFFPNQFLFTGGKPINAIREVFGFEWVFHEIKQSIDEFVLGFFVLEEGHKGLASEGLADIVEAKKHFIEGLIRYVRKCSNGKCVTLVKEAFFSEILRMAIIASQGFRSRKSPRAKILVIEVECINDVSHRI